MIEPSGDLTPREREALAALPRDAAPPPGLEDVTVAALRERGLLRPAAPGRRRGLRLGLALAASVALFATGMLVGRRLPAVPAPSAAAQFVLLLYEGPEYRPPAPGREGDRVREYSEWAGERAAREELVAGEKLREDADVVIERGGAVRTTPPEAGAERLAGYFVIRASGPARALEIARTCPHVRYGGSIVIREIEPT